MANPTGTIVDNASERWSQKIESGVVLTKGDLAVQKLAEGVSGTDGYLACGIASGAVNDGKYAGIVKDFSKVDISGAVTGDGNAEATVSPKGQINDVTITGATQAKVGQPVYIAGNTGSMSFTMTGARTNRKFGILANFKSATNGCRIKYGDVDKIRKVLTETADATLNDDDDEVLIDTSSGDVTLTLPTAVGRAGKEIVVTCIDRTNVPTLDGDGTETIDGALTYVFAAQWESITVVSDGANWFIK